MEQTINPENNFESVKKLIIDERILEINQFIKRIAEFEENNNILDDLRDRCETRLKKAVRRFIKKKIKEVNKNDGKI